MRLAELEKRQRDRFFSFSGGLNEASVATWPALSSVSNSEWSVMDDLECSEAAGERDGCRWEFGGFSAEPGGMVATVGVSTGVADVFWILG